MTNKIFCYGDSNAAAEQMPAGQSPFVHWVAKDLGFKYVNYAAPGASMGKILHSLVSTHTEISADDIVLITIPPDTRWYDENEERGFYSLVNYDRDNYFKFLNQKTFEWFRYHHALFIYSMQKVLDDIGCYYIMSHVYGDIVDIKKYKLQIDFSRFLSEVDLLNLLNIQNNDAMSYWNPYNESIPKYSRFDKDCPGEWYSNKSNPLIMPDGHPSELGHKKIAEIILEKYRNDKK